MLPVVVTRFIPMLHLKRLFITISLIMANLIGMIQSQTYPRTIPIGKEKVKLSFTNFICIFNYFSGPLSQ